MESDIALARHVTYVHQHKKNPELDFEPFDPKFLKVYISQVMLSLLPAVSREQVHHNLPQGFGLRHPLPPRYEVATGCVVSPGLLGDEVSSLGEVKRVGSTVEVCCDSLVLSRTCRCVFSEGQDSWRRRPRSDSVVCVDLRPCTRTGTR